jgi:hypothetical protein
MTSKKVLAAHAISSLQEQFTRFNAMSVLLAKSADLATNQSNEIAEWTSKLINAVTKVRDHTQREAAACQERLKNKICELTTQANSRKRKALDSSDLEVRTLKANFRLIFGPAKVKQYPSKNAKYVEATNLRRINDIRGLSGSHPHGVVALSVAYPSKVWTESSSEVFDSIIKSIKDEAEQTWPDEIVDIMGELEKERPMVVEFSNLRGMINLANLKILTNS